MFAEYMASMALTPAESFELLSNKLFTIESEDTAPGDDTDIVSGILTGTAPSEEISVTTEMNNHSMAQLVDALAVQSLLKGLNPIWEVKNTGCLISLSSNDPGESEETLVNELSCILLQGDAAVPLKLKGEAGFWFKPADFKARSELHDRLFELEQAVSGQSLRIEVFATADEEGHITPLSASDIESLASIDIAYRYALVNLNPFALIGANYDRFNENGELNFTNDGGQLSEAWLTDRAAMLHWKMQYDASDTKYGDEFSADISGDWDYTDLGMPGMALKIDGNGIELTNHQVVFGSSKGDHLEGGSKSDHLYGMSGNDVIHGLGGDDYIEGGKGRDTMYGGEDNDTFYIQGGDTDYDTFNGGGGIDTL